MKVLVTGGTGTVGRALVAQLLKDRRIKVVRVLGRSETRILQFLQDHPSDPRLDVVTGDVADLRSMELNTQGMDVVFHLAAMKHVDLIEKDPYVAMTTNIEGTKNAVDASLRAEVQRFVLMSTDKAVHASSLYGATKLVAEKVVLAANRVRPIFNVYRSGNVLNSSGSVLEVWQRHVRANNTMAITDPAMTRYFLGRGALAERLAEMPTLRPGIVYVPKCDAFRLDDLAGVSRVLIGDRRTRLVIVGRRPGEKDHEELVSIEELARTTEHDDHYLIEPARVKRPLGKVPSSSDATVPVKRLKVLVAAELREGASRSRPARKRTG